MAGSQLKVKIKLNSHQLESNKALRHPKTFRIRRNHRDQRCCDRVLVTKVWLKLTTADLKLSSILQELKS